MDLDSDSILHPFVCAQCELIFSPHDDLDICQYCGGQVQAFENPHLHRFPRHVLLVEDSVVSRKKILAILKSLGCVATAAANGQDGLVKARDRVPDLIVLDVQMPVMDGLEALAELRLDSQFDKTPIVMLTTQFDEVTVRTAIMQRANDYIRKDHSVADIRERLKGHLKPLAE